MKPTLLLVEDDPTIGHSVSTFLQASYTVDWLTHGQQALEKLYDTTYDLVILDIMLPGMDGHTLLKEIRKLGTTPVLMLSALSDDTNQLQAFTQQADDYVSKPFSIALLLARVEALLRRSGATQDQLTLGELVLYPNDYRTMYQNQEVTLTLKEFKILLHLAKNQGRVLSQEALLSHLYGYDFDRLENTLQVHIKNIRSKISFNYIKTIRGVGYKLEVPS